MNTIIQTAFEKEFNEQMMNLGLKQSPESQITVKV